MDEVIWMLGHVSRSLRRQTMLWRRDFTEWRRFWARYRRYEKLAPPDRRPSLSHLYPCLGDDMAETPVEPVYFYQDAWAFEKIVKQRPESHIDVGSHHKFVSLLSNVLPVIMVDVRPLSWPLSTVEFRQGSILDLPFEDATVPSLSSLCVAEHIGLGRYGGPLDPYGSEKAVDELKRVLAPSGRLYLSVPIGDRNIVAFDAGRVFALKYFLELVHPLLVLEQRFIVGGTLQDTYEHRPMFGTTGLFELMKAQTTDDTD
ncbi:MAG: DUF268 domain-containing protein [Anaerolineae bacterium]